VAVDNLKTGLRTRPITLRGTTVAPVPADTVKFLIDFLSRIEGVQVRAG
jgi:hypothetical protein